MRVSPLIATVLLVSCQSEEKPRSLKEKSVIEAPKSVMQAVAYVHPTEGNEAHGRVTFDQVDGGVQVTADIEGLMPGKHGFHIHEHGDCSAPDASSAGGHFNPTNKPHGGPESQEHHVGDLGNLEADAEGRAHFEFASEELELNGPNSIIGKSVIVHADEDDLTTQPTGNSGARVGCGTIDAKE
ncbi:MAG: superoxide dismutase family protein [Chlamydiia bacterium]|nr:superoxide dismutase family protein [Chlamydiia bacterium]